MGKKEYTYIKYRIWKEQNDKNNISSNLRTEIYNQIYQCCKKDLQSCVKDFKEDTRYFAVNKIGKKLIETENNDELINCDVLEIKILKFGSVFKRWPEHMILEFKRDLNRYCLTLIDKIPVNESDETIC